MRPCRFAGPASAIRLHSPVPKSLTSMASPTAKMSGSLVRMCSSTRMPPRSPIVEAGRLGQRGVRLHANREDDDVRRERFAGAGLDLDGAAVQLLESDHAVIGDHLHAMPFDVALDEARDLRVQRGQDMIGLLDQGHVEPEMDQVLRRFQTDESAADDHRAASPA